MNDTPPAPPDAALRRLHDDIRAEAAGLPRLRDAAAAPEAGDARTDDALDGARRRYRLDELVNHHGEAFVAHAWQCLIGRSPDPAALLAGVERLQRGDSKIALLGDLRRSPDGRRQGVQVQGLGLRYAFWRATQWPLLGRAIETLALLAALPGLAREQRRLGQALHDDELHIEVEALRQELEALRRRVERAPPP